jgi:hypothetical protein
MPSKQPVEHLLFVAVAAVIAPSGQEMVLKLTTVNLAMLPKDSRDRLVAPHQVLFLHVDGTLKSTLLANQVSLVRSCPIEPRHEELPVLMAVVLTILTCCRLTLFLRGRFHFASLLEEILSR